MEAPRLNGGNSGNIEYLYIVMSTEQCVRILVHRYTVYNGMPIICLPIEMQIKLHGARETISVISQPKPKSMLSLFLQRMYSTLSTVYLSNVLALYSFYPPEPKCITQSKMQRSQINFAQEIWLRSHRSGQHCSTVYLITHYTPYDQLIITDEDNNENANELMTRESFDCQNGHKLTAQVDRQISRYT